MVLQVELPLNELDKELLKVCHSSVGGEMV